MRAIIMAAGVGQRLSRDPQRLPKCLLRFGGKTLLRRHLEILNQCGVVEVVLGVGYRAEAIAAELAAFGPGMAVRSVHNPRFELGSNVTLWTLREHLMRSGDVLLMDADVLYDHRLIERLLGSRHANCFLLDRDFEPGDEPVKLCVREGRLVEFRKKIDVCYDFCGESVGFFRLAEAQASRLAELSARYVEAGLTDQPYEEPLRDLLLAAESGSFGFEDITGIPWVEIDFAEDVVRARDEILPQLSDIGR